MAGGRVRIRVPGDKSLTQRALILASLAEGESRISGLLHGGDADSTAAALRQLGVAIPEIPGDGSSIRVRGRGLRGLQAPERTLDLGNSGTGTRLLLGVLAGAGVAATVDGDESLRGRPMARVTDPLGAMGATFTHLGEAGRLPIRVGPGGVERPIDWASPVASAQVKSAILLAGLSGGVFALVTEPRRSRDHTERLFGEVGAPVISHAVADGWRVELRDPPAAIGPLDFDVPGDLSSAAFFLAAGALGVGGGAVTVESVGLNPTRTGFLSVLERMGGRIDVDETSAKPEPLGTITVAPTQLTATTVGGDEVPALIDELPLVAVLAARAVGTTTVTGAEELRAKESDRIATVVDNLRAVGAHAEELEDGFVVEGRDAPLRGHVRTHADHRIAMAFAVLGAVPGCEITIDDPGAAAVSFPGFHELLARVAAEGVGS